MLKLKKNVVNREVAQDIFKIIINKKQPLLHKTLKGFDSDYLIQNSNNPEQIS